MKPSVLYITYLGLLEPIPQSQIVPYLVGLSSMANIHVLSFEKKNFLEEKTTLKTEMEKLFESKHIHWHWRSYHKHPLILSSFFDIFMGFIYSLFLIFKFSIRTVHARSNIPIAIGFLLKLFLPIRLIYDRRGMMGDEHIEQSQWKPTGYLYRGSKIFEKWTFKKSDAIVVLTNRIHHQIKQDKLVAPSTSITTIPCCVDLSLFKSTDKQISKDDHFMFVYQGTLGTYNLVSELFSFFEVARNKISNAKLLIFSPQMKAVQD